METKTTHAMGLLQLRSFPVQILFFVVMFVGFVLVYVSLTGVMFASVLPVDLLRITGPQTFNATPLVDLPVYSKSTSVHQDKNFSFVDLSSKSMDMKLDDNATPFVDLSNKYMDIRQQINVTPFVDLPVASMKSPSQQSRVNEDGIDISNYASNCQENELLELQFSEASNTTIFVPSSNKASCPRSLTEASSKIPLTLLISFPGSGNTWMRHLLQQLTGLPIGSVYRDVTLKEGGFPFEGELTNVIAVKTHEIEHPRLYDLKPDRMIVIVRNVYEAIISTYKFFAAGHTANVIIKNNNDWHAMFKELSKMFDSFMTKTFRFTGPILILYYEDLKRDPMSQLTRIAEFLSNDEVKEFSFCCVSKRNEGKNHRLTHGQTAEEVYQPKKIIRLNGLLDQHSELLRQRFPELAERLLTYKLRV